MTLFPVFLRSACAYNTSSRRRRESRICLALNSVVENVVIARDVQRQLAALLSATVREFSATHTRQRPGNLRSKDCAAIVRPMSRSCQHGDLISPIGQGQLQSCNILVTQGIIDSLASRLLQALQPLGMGPRLLLQVQNCRRGPTK